MANSDYIPAKDPEFVTFGNNYSTVCANSATELGLSAPELTQISGVVNEFNEAYVAMNAAKLVYEGLVDAKNVARASAVSVIRSFTREFKANPTVSPATLGALGVVVNNPSVPVTPVTLLTATGCSNGENLLRWNRNGNSSGTQFIIEAKIGDSGAWNLVWVSSTVRFTHENQIPGQKISYRVTAIRNGQASAPCDPFVLYSEGEGFELNLAA